ncbi:flagellar basal body rod protein FlgF [Salinisphaera sp. Q1T1-3]|uniref:flagellar basal body rod protein FlgF n=1 Tax=Salinisphaera sp. Q1T1-3 TaxID=2321229 RepID=UPI000E72BE6E|nr:flagellar basal body rod protein FlgF [Salinisphaera sp. Q1T1-3]RJS95170.1 flagellar basal body rod protein FlgF [Salinisphaera sp. Q1T1-3]
MDRLIYTALSGASQILDRQSVVANNLANASTTGFKAELSAYRAVPVNGGGLATRAITAQTTPQADLSQGGIEHTGRSLDVAVDGAGWLSVQADDGSEAYTRNGNLQMDATGMLRSAGRPVLSRNGQPIVLPLNATVSIAADGTISALGGGEEPNTMTDVGQLKLVGAGDNGMHRRGDGLFQRGAPGTPDDGPAPFDGTVRLVSGALESSNVSPTETMVSMIGDARQFEMQMKMLSSADDNARAANRLLDVT